jgi:PAS domain S-box-containing protein
VHRLDAFGLTDMLEISASIRDVSTGAGSMEEAAGAIVDHLRSSLIDKDTGQPSLALVRFYKTLPLSELDPPLQAFARGVAAEAHLDDIACLTLLASAGEEPSWNDRTASRGHKAIPLQSAQAVQRSPMIAELVRGLGLDAEQVVKARSPLLRELAHQTFGVFYEPTALGSPHIPAQDDFVVPYGIKSALGFGGVLPSGSLFAVVMFSTTPIPPETADAFATVAVSVKLAVLRHAGRRVFDWQPPDDSAPSADDELHVLRSQVAAMEELLDVRGGAVTDQAARLQDALSAANERAAELAISQSALAASQARKSAIVDGALDSVVSMDASGHVLEWNHAAEETFGFTRDEAVGSMLADLIIPVAMRDRHTRGLAEYLRTGEGPVIGKRIEVTALRADGSELPVELSITPVAGVEPPIFSGYLRDITERRRTETELLAGRERLAHIAHTLQASLLPPVLPRIPNVELASAYRAAGEGNEVGGDFYDVFELSAGRWALILGDVCGKGPEAAALTGLVRYTVRAAAMKTRRPQGVLGTLNEAIHRQHPESFCTAALAVLDPVRRRLTLASGGHPAPLLLRATGEIEVLEARGQLLGPFPEWKGSIATAELQPDDAIVLFSDGVTEARMDHEFYGDERLREAARSASGSSAAEIVRRIESEVLAFTPTLTDDLAILAARVVDSDR